VDYEHQPKQAQLLKVDGLWYRTPWPITYRVRQNMMFWSTPLNGTMSNAGFDFLLQLALAWEQTDDLIIEASI
jgi:hypothetical protein